MRKEYGINVNSHPFFILSEMVAHKKMSTIQQPATTRCCSSYISKYDFKRNIAHI